MSETKYEGQINTGMYFSVFDGVRTVERVVSIDELLVHSRFKLDDGGESWLCTYPVSKFRSLARPVAPPDRNWEPYVSKERDRARSGLMHEDLRVGDVVSVDSKYSHFVARITGTSNSAVPFEPLAGDYDGEDRIIGWIAYCRVLIPAEKAEPAKTEYAVAQDLSPENRKRLSDAAKASRLQEVAEVEKVTEMVPGGVYALRYRHIDGTISRAASGAVEYLGPGRVRWFELEDCPSGGERSFSTAAAHEVYRVIRMKPVVVTDGTFPPAANRPPDPNYSETLLEVSAGTKDYRVTGSLRRTPAIKETPFSYMVKVISLDGKTCEKVCDGADSDEGEARITMMDRFAAEVTRVMDEG